MSDEMRRLARIAAALEAIQAALERLVELNERRERRYVPTGDPPIGFVHVRWRKPEEAP